MCYRKDAAGGDANYFRYGMSFVHSYVWLGCATHAPALARRSRRAFAAFKE